MDFMITSDEGPFSYGSAIKTVAKCKRKAIAPQQALPRKPQRLRVLAQTAARINQIGVWNGDKCRNLSGMDYRIFNLEAEPLRQAHPGCGCGACRVGLPARD